MDDWPYTISTDKNTSAAHVLAVLKTVAQNFGTVKVVSRPNGNALRIKSSKAASTLFLFARERPKPDQTVVEVRWERKTRVSYIIGLVGLALIFSWSVVVPFVVIFLGIFWFFLGCR